MDEIVSRDAGRDAIGAGRGRRPAARSALATVVLVTVFGLGAGVGWAGRGPVPDAGAGAAPELSETDGFETLDDTWTAIQDYYVDLDAVDEDALIYGAATGMVEALGDTGHSRFLDPEQAESFIQAMSGRRVGIGIGIEPVGDQFVVTTVLPDSPAEAAGIGRGDVLLAVDGQDVDRLTDIDLAILLRGEEDTVVALTLQRPDEAEAYEVEVTRAVLVIEPVTWGMLPDNVGFIHIRQFSSGAAAGVQDAVSDLRERGATALVLDLRDNPGGLVFEAIATASQFMSEGEVIYRQEDRAGATETFRTVDGGVALDLPMSVMVNASSASAAEIVGGALRDNGRADLIGETTYGTGTVLNTVELDDGSLVVIGTRLWLTPAGDSIWRVGVAPDTEVSLDPGTYPTTPEDDAEITAGELRRSDDTQLRAAFDAVTGSVTAAATPGS
ncbi:MAG: S41 family peptidase [Chloroflexota bacterium]|nr:S41 family peptidase [Chloroflexota bacterium]